MKNKNLFATMMVLFLLAVIVVGSYGTMSVQAAGKLEGNKQEYHLEEKSYLENLRQKLEDKGYYNSGITLTKVMTEEGQRDYTVLIHNSAIDRLDESERGTLAEELQSVGNIGNNSQICYEFLVIS